jgi:Uma2 family endonuclease
VPELFVDGGFRVDILVTDKDLKRELLRKRREWGGDHHDEVWNGVYIMSPLANDEHQRLVLQFSMILETVLRPAGDADVRPGANVSDRREKWRQNYRVPDVVVRFHDGVSEICDTHWFGGPDFLIEIASRGDRSRKKLSFYAAIGVREVMILDRQPWAVELYRLGEGVLGLVGKSTLDDPKLVASEVVPLSFRLVQPEKEPRIVVIHRDGEPQWLV